MKLFYSSVNTTMNYNTLKENVYFRKQRKSNFVRHLLIEMFNFHLSGFD